MLILKIFFRNYFCTFFLFLEKISYICFIRIICKKFESYGQESKMGTIDDAGFCNGLFDSEERSSGKAAGPGSGSARVERQIRLMYGVRPPVPVEEVERQQAIREKTARKEVKKAQRAREKEAPASKNE